MRLARLAVLFALVVAILSLPVVARLLRVVAANLLGDVVAFLLGHRSAKFLDLPVALWGCRFRLLRGSNSMPLSAIELLRRRLL